MAFDLLRVESVLVLDDVAYIAPHRRHEKVAHLGVVVRRPFGVEQFFDAVAGECRAGAPHVLEQKPQRANIVPLGLSFENSSDAHDLRVDIPLLDAGGKRARSLHDARVAAYDFLEFGEVVAKHHERHNFASQMLDIVPPSLHASGIRPQIRVDILGVRHESTRRSGLELLRRRLT